MRRIRLAASHPVSSSRRASADVDRGSGNNQENE
jgi:hypothetical protein